MKMNELYELLTDREKMICQELKGDAAVVIPQLVIHQVMKNHWMEFEVDEYYKLKKIQNDDKNTHVFMNEFQMFGNEIRSIRNMLYDVVNN